MLKIAHGADAMGFFRPLLDQQRQTVSFMHPDGMRHAPLIALSGGFELP